MFQALIPILRYYEFMPTGSILTRILLFIASLGETGTNIVEYCFMSYTITTSGLDSDKVKLLLDQLGAGTSTKQMLHYLQIINSGEYLRNLSKSFESSIEEVNDFHSFFIPIMFIFTYQKILVKL